METSQVFAYIGLTASFLATIPQIFKMIQTKDVEGVSMITYFLVILTNICFTVRSVEIGETAYTISNLIKVITSLMVFYLYYKYRKKKC